MKTLRRLSIPLTLFLFILLPVTALLCGTERWPVKVCKDAKVNLLFKGNDIAGGTLKTPISTTVLALTSWTPPAHRGNVRIAPTEATIWVIEATITEYKEEKGATGDNDYHLALDDGAGNTMVAEIPSPGCLTNTPEPLRSMIKQARSDFKSRFTVTGGFKQTNTKVRITGPAMFDRPHATGAAPNGIEIHPIIKIEFLN
jgi:hypothetical protein